MRNDLPIDQVSLLRLIHNDLEQLHVLGEEEIAVPEPCASCRLGGQHVQPLPPSHYCERSYAVLPAAFQIPQLVDLLLAIGVLRQRNLVVDDLHHVALLVNRHLGDMRRAAPWPSPRPTSTRRPSSLPL